MEELISIIIPVLNTDNFYLEKCLQSLNSQSYKNLEIIFVDGGSKKECIDKLAYFCSKNKNSFIFSSEKGVSKQRNVGLKHAKGKFILFVDSDDCINDLFVETLYTTLINSNADVAISHSIRMEYVDHVLKNTIPYDIASPNRIVTSKNYFEFVRTSNFANIRNLYKRELLEGKEFNNNSSYGEDLLFNYSLTSRPFSAVFCKEAKYFYSVETKINSASRRLNNSGIFIIDELYKIYKATKEKDNLNGKNLYKEFCTNFNIFYYESARSKNRDILKQLSKYKKLYFKHHHKIHDILYLVAPIYIVGRRNKNAK